MSAAAKSIFDMYRKSLYLVVPFTTCVGFSSGLTEVFTKENKVSALSLFTDVIAFTTIGALTGLTYPITFPAIMKSVIIDD
jgi:hypothetical protein